jgi:hypothetical protein
MYPNRVVRVDAVPPVSVTAVIDVVNRVISLRNARHEWAVLDPDVALPADAVVDRIRLKN